MVNGPPNSSRGRRFSLVLRMAPGPSTLISCEDANERPILISRNHVGAEGEAREGAGGARAPGETTETTKTQQGDFRRGLIDLFFFSPNSFHVQGCPLLWLLS